MESLETCDLEGLIAGEALLNAAGNVYNEARAKLPRDKDRDRVWRTIIEQREAVTNELHRRRRATKR